MRRKSCTFAAEFADISRAILRINIEEHVYLGTEQLAEICVG